MKSLKIIGTTKDLRTATNVLYAQITITDYLELVGENFDRFEIQRPRQTHKAYKRMQTDIAAGGLLPSITLAVNPKSVAGYIKILEEGDFITLSQNLFNSKNIYILDGLQRTYIISDLKKAGTKFNRNQKLLLEFWFEKEIKHLIYRLIVLNAGQKPMSMRHQVELLFMTMQDKIQSEIKSLELYAERDETRRNKPKKFPFDRIVTAYYCFVTKSSEMKRENLVVQELNELEILNSSEEELSDSFNEFMKVLDKYVQLDSEVFRIYEDFTNTEIKSPKNWLAEENVINSFFSAVSQFSTDNNRKKRMTTSLNLLLSNIKKSPKGTDPLGLKELAIVRSGINPKKFNVGFETRKTLTNGFKEFFRETGDIEIKECWRMGAN